MSKCKYCDCWVGGTDLNMTVCGNCEKMIKEEGKCPACKGSGQGYTNIHASGIPGVLGMYRMTHDCIICLGEGEGEFSKLTMRPLKKRGRKSKWFKGLGERLRMAHA